MTTEIVTPAVTVPETLPAAAPQDPQAFLDKASPAETLEWRKTGKFPTDKPKTETPATSKETSASGTDGTAAASETASEQEARRSKGTPAPQRINELLAERKRDRERIAELERKVATPKAEEKPASATGTETAKPGTAEPPAKPKMNDKNADGTPKYKDYGTWEDAKDQWIEDRATEKAAARLRTEDQQRSQQAEERKASETWKTRVDDTAKSIADFGEVINAAIEAKHPIFTKVPVGSVLEHFIYRVAEHGPQMLYHFVKVPGEFERILAIRDRFQLDRELFKIDESFATASADTEKKNLPAPKVTEAPPPARTLAGRGTKPADEVASAVRDGDTARYIREANAREIAALKGSR